MQHDPGRAAYEARFAHARPRDVEPWDSLRPEVKDIWRRVAAACRAPLWEETAGAQAERAEICRELGCVDKPGIPLMFVQQLRNQMGQANARTSELIRMWDPASHTERQELDRMRRGWGPSTPTERELRRSDVAACIRAVSIAMSDVTVSEEEADDVPEEARDRLDEAYERLSKVHTTLVETVRRICSDPKEWPDIRAAEERGAAKAQQEADRWSSEYANAMDARMADAAYIETLHVALTVLAECKIGSGLAAVRKWFADGARGLIPWPDGTLFAAWAARHEIYDCNGAMGFRRGDRGRAA
ncbi:hypothetical protein [Methylobacterium fujisawaense]|jgi:hypothetical protein